MELGFGSAALRPHGLPRMKESTVLHLYFHSPCFDGIVSTVLLSDYLTVARSVVDITLHGVNYHLRGTWKAFRLEQPSAVIDFLYHPEATIWFDHHLTTFLDRELRASYECRKGPELVYDSSAGSCAGLLWRHLWQEFGYRNPAHDEKVAWAERIDAARYESPVEAIRSEAPALRINAALALGDREVFPKFLVEKLRSSSMAEVADLPETCALYERFALLSEVGLERFCSGARLTADGIVTFDVDGLDALVSRYAPFYVFPEARYSVGVVRNRSRGTLTAMRNPWLEFVSVPLGEIFSDLGGGGHRRVASTILDSEHLSEAPVLIARVLDAIRAAELVPEELSHDREI